MTWQVVSIRPLPAVSWDDGCAVCGGDVAAGPVLLCDECDGEYHCACLDPALDKVGKSRCHPPRRRHVLSTRMY